MDKFQTMNDPWSLVAEKAAEPLKVPLENTKTEDWLYILRELNGWGIDGWKTKISEGRYP